MLVLYESIDLGLLNRSDAWETSEDSTLNKLQENLPAFVLDPIRSDSVHVYCPFGLHTLSFGHLLSSLTDFENEKNGDTSTCALSRHPSVMIQPILNTPFSGER